MAQRKGQGGGGGGPKVILRRPDITWTLENESLVLSVATMAMKNGQPQTGTFTVTAFGRAGTEKLTNSGQVLIRLQRLTTTEATSALTIRFEGDDNEIATSRHFRIASEDRPHPTPARCVLLGQASNTMMGSQSSGSV